MLVFTQWFVRWLQRLTLRKSKPTHLALGQKGEAEAYFYLRRLGYRIVATNFRAPHDRGEIDLIGWDKDVLCFIEVKTRTDDSFAPPSTAVTKEKQAHIRAVAKSYLRRSPGDNPPSCRFDVVSVVPSGAGQEPQITLSRAAFSWSSGRKPRREYRDYFERRFRRDTRNLPRFR
jgi:putative endonuclease